MVDQLDGVFGALGDPTRRAIVARLAEGETPLAALAEPFEMSLPSVSKHVRVLIAAGLVAQEKARPHALLPARARPAPGRRRVDRELRGLLAGPARLARRPRPRPDAR